MKKNHQQLNLVLVNIWYFPVQTPHFGLMSLAAFINQKLPEIKISIIEGLDPYPEVIKQKPDVIGFTSDTLTYQQTVKLARHLRKKLLVPFVIGGVHISALPESFNPIFDIGVIGEGEITLWQLLRTFITNGGFLSNKIIKIKGLVYFLKGKLIFSGERQLIKEIDKLPYPARHLVPMKEKYLKDQINLFKVKRIVPLMTSRGCPYHCVFCGSPVHWGRVRFHSAEHIINEIKLMISQYQIDGVMFWDDLFITPEKRLIKLVKLIKKERLEKKVAFFGYARANLINHKVGRLLKEINTRRLIFGLESGSSTILNYLKQNSVSVDDNKKAIKICRQYNISVASGYIVGIPEETVSDLKKTYNFMRDYPLDHTQIYILTPYPGTVLWRKAQQQKLVSPVMDFSQLFVQLPNLSFSDFFRKIKRTIIKNRIFLNPSYRKNQDYLALILKMQKLASFQNLCFYLIIFSKNPGWFIRLSFIYVKRIFRIQNEHKYLT